MTTVPPEFIDDSSQRRVCAICARVLDYVEPAGWVHTRQDPDDHPVVPVTDAEVQVRSRCDFCSAEPTVSFVVSRPLRMVGVPVDDSDDSAAVPLSESNATWACCAVCDRLIRRGRWPEVTHRALRSMRASGQFGPVMDPMVVQALRDLHAGVADNMVGQPVRYP